MKFQLTMFKLLLMLLLPLITLSAQNDLSIKSSEVLPLAKNVDPNRALLHRKHSLNNPQKSKLSFKLNPDLNNKQSTSQSSNTGFEAFYIEFPIGIMRTITSRGDYGNIYSVGFGFGFISSKMEGSFIFFTGGLGRTKEGIQYYHETLEPGTKISGLTLLEFDFGYNISPIKKIRFSPMIGLTLGSFTEMRGSRDRGILKYEVEERWIPKVGFDIFLLPKGTNFILFSMRLKYRYTNISKKGKFVKDVNVIKHIVTLGMNFLSNE